jgi:hypothetical protein
MVCAAYLQTGQTTCHDALGRQIDCNGSGQDAELQCGVPWPEPRFATVGETVLDCATGLVWSKNANLAEFPMTWREALAFVSQMNQEQALGFTDWRLPNRRELRSLVSHQTRRPALPAGHPFYNVFASWYWTSTTAAMSPAHAWYVHMDGARMFYGGKDQSFLVWPVRGEGNGVLPATGQVQCHDEAGRPVSCDGTGQDAEICFGHGWPTPRFHVQEQVVADRLTRLCWQRPADLAGRAVSWMDALGIVAELNCVEKSLGWRLPNINELESLVDCSHHSPALPGGHPFLEVRDIYWSSTTSMFEPDWAWAMYLDKGAVGVGQKAYALFHVWAVRDSAS